MQAKSEFRQPILHSARNTLVLHRWNCSACRYGDCKKYSLLERKYLKLIEERKNFYRGIGSNGQKLK